jgi:hypothetical protein
MASGEEPSLHSVLKVPVHSLEVLELVKCHHEGLALFQSLCLVRPTQYCAYSSLRDP